MSKRSRVEEIFTKILAVLDDGQEHTLTNLSHETRISQVTISKYVDLILKIQENPKVEKREEGNTILVKIK
jgi:response regulator of citrate/malate metabolism